MRFFTFFSQLLIFPVNVWINSARLFDNEILYEGLDG